MCRLGSVCDRQVEQPREQRFSPYQNNGGTCLAIAGKDFCIVAADSRLSLGYSILSRTSPKVAQLTSKCCIASSGCQADMITLQKLLKFRLQVCVPWPPLPLAFSLPLAFPKPSRRWRRAANA